jgi:hypothetical protein
MALGGKLQYARAPRVVRREAKAHGGWPSSHVASPSTIDLKSSIDRLLTRSTLKPVDFTAQLTRCTTATDVRRVWTNIVQLANSTAHERVFYAIATSESYAAFITFTDLIATSALHGVLSAIAFDESSANLCATVCAHTPFTRNAPEFVVYRGEDFCYDSHLTSEEALRACLQKILPGHCCPICDQVLMAPMPMNSSKLNSLAHRITDSTETTCSRQALWKTFLGMTDLSACNRRMTTPFRCQHTVHELCWQCVDQTRCVVCGCSDALVGASDGATGFHCSLPGLIVCIQLDIPVAYTMLILERVTREDAPPKTKAIDEGLQGSFEALARRVLACFVDLAPELAAEHSISPMNDVPLYAQ